MRTDSAGFAQKNVELAKDPRYVIVLSFDSANAVLWGFTSHADAALPPGLAGSILGVLEGLSGTSQTLNPDTANASIGSISFSLVDRLSIVTTTLGGQLVLGRSTRKQRVQVYVGYQGLAWADYTLVQTQLVTEIAFADGAYKFTCADIQREMRKDIFELAKTTLALSLDEVAATVEVYVTTGFSTVAHGTSYSDAPSATVGYIKIEDEVIRYTGKTSTQFTGCVRGALNTRAVAHNVDATAAAERHPAVTEYVYLELPAIDLMYRLLTGKDRLGASVMPSTWNLGIATSYVRLADFTGIGTDLWDTADDLQGFLVRFEDLGKTDGKKFIETELALLCGVFMPIYADGALGCKRMANILSGAAYTGVLDERNVVSYGDLVHDFGSLHNLIAISWNWEPLQAGFTRPNEAFLDAGSIAVHGRADPYTLKFRGLHGSRHTRDILSRRFDSLRDRYTGPPLRLDVAVVPSLNTSEVGDVKRVRLANVRDFTAPGGGGPIDRSFEIQNVQVDWVTGALKLKLFASSQAPGQVAPAASTLNSTWRTATGTALASVLTITGSNPGHVSASGSLAGNVDMNAAGAIYYYDGDLQIDAGVVITISNNVQLRTKFLQNNGKINGKGGGLAAGAVGTAGFLGSTEAGGGLVVQPPVFGTVVSNRGTLVAGRNAAMPFFNLRWDGTTLSGLPGDLRGSSGSTGNQVTGRFGSSAAGGVGGAGGAGLTIICDGFAQGANGSIDLSGADGSSGGNLSDSGATFYAGSGAGGAGGGLLVLLDTAAAAATGLTDAGFVCLNGATPIGPGQRAAVSDTLAGSNYSFFPGIGSEANLSDSRGGSRVQPVPPNALATVDPRILTSAILLEEFLAGNWTNKVSIGSSPTLRAVAWAKSLPLFVAVGDANTDALILTSPNGEVWTERANPKAFNLLGVAWNGTTLVAVGIADGGDAYIVSSTDGTTWTERANPKNFRLRAVTWANGLFVAVGDADGGDAYIVTSPDGTTWTERANPKNISLAAVAWTGTKFIAGGNTDFSIGAPRYPYLITSPDGITWTQKTTLPTGVDPNITGIAANPAILNKIVAVGFGTGVTTYLASSVDDGETWVNRVSAIPVRSVALNAIAASSGLFIAVGDPGVLGGYILTSLDGANWRERAGIGISVPNLNGVAFGDRFVAVGTVSGVTSIINATLQR